MLKQFLLLFLATALFSFDMSENLAIRSFATLDLSVKEKEESTDYSIAGVQVDYDVTQSLNIMVQGIYSQRGRDASKYESSLEWAMIGYKFGDRYQIRGGQFKVPFMNASDTQYIGYSRLWTRPLILYNGTNGFEKVKGLEFVGNYYINEIDIDYQITYGKAEHIENKDKNDYLWGIVLKASYEKSWLRVSYGELFFVHENPEATEFEEGILAFASIETKLNYQAFDFYAGYGFNKNDIIPDDSYKYLSVSYILGKFIPYVLYTNMSRKGLPYTTGLPTLNNPSPPPKRINNGYTISEGYSLGLRYNINEMFIAKFQYTKESSIAHESYTGDVLIDTDTYSLTLDMVF